MEHIIQSSIALLAIISILILSKKSDAHKKAIEDRDKYIEIDGSKGRIEQLLKGELETAQEEIEFIKHSYEIKCNELEESRKAHKTDVSKAQEDIYLLKRLIKEQPDIDIDKPKWCNNQGKCHIHHKCKEGIVGWSCMVDTRKVTMT